MTTDALFAEGKDPKVEPCAEYLSSVAEHIELKFKPGGSAAKAPFIEQVRKRVAKRLPASK